MHYVMSDIHGNMRRFRSVMKQINLKNDDTLYVLGDVIDRFPDGLRILRELMAMPNAKMLLGNHEFIMLDTLGEPYDGHIPNDINHTTSLWHRIGGDVTHHAWKHLRKTTRAEIMDYLKSLPLSFDVEVNGKEYKLVHGSPIELSEKRNHHYRSKEAFAVWNRIQWFDHTEKNPILVFGHTPAWYYDYSEPLQIYISENKIGIDCGSGFPEDSADPSDALSRLACLRLEDMKVFYSEEPHPLHRF